MQLRSAISNDLFWECMTIADRILFMLREQEWVTTTEFLNTPGLYTFRNRISELNRHGHHIEAQKIEGKSIYRYRLRE